MTSPGTRDDRFTTLPGVPIVVNPLLNDDFEGLTVSLSSLTTTSPRFEIISDTEIRYTPATGFTGVERFSYKVEEEVPGSFNRIYTGTIDFAVFSDDFGPQNVVLDEVTIYDPFVFIDLAGVVDPGNLVDETFSIWDSNGIGLEQFFADGFAVIDPGQFAADLSAGESLNAVLTLRADHDGTTAYSTVTLPVIAPIELDEPYTGPVGADVSGNGVADTFVFEDVLAQGVAVDADLDRLQLGGAKVDAVIETFSGASVFSGDEILSVFGDDVRADTLQFTGGDLSDADVDADRFAAYFATREEAAEALGILLTDTENELWDIINFASTNEILGVAPADFIG